jgi:hypothetical protein
MLKAFFRLLKGAVTSDATDRRVAIVRCFCYLCAYVRTCVLVGFEPTNCRSWGWCNGQCTTKLCRGQVLEHRTFITFEPL